MITAIIAAAGKGVKAKQNKNKVLSSVNGKTVLEMTLLPFLKNERVDEIIIAIGRTDEEEMKELVNRVCTRYFKPIKLVYGGGTRSESVVNALKAAQTDIVLIHDGARPYLTEELLDRCIDCTIKYGSAVPTVPAVDTMSRVYDDGRLAYGEDRSRLCSVQTPQCFFHSQILKAYSMVCETDNFTDDAGVYSKYIEPAKTVEGDVRNKKLTFKSDFDGGVLYNTGIGFDMHKLTEGRKLILGGVQIPHEKGLLGHSDADVLTHALMDALLSAAGLKDIGHYFPDTDDKYKDISSLTLLEQVISLLEQKGYSVHNAAAVIMAEKPKLAPYVDKIIHKLSQVMHISPENLGITCTTLEGLGFIGREEGIGAHATALIYKDDTVNN